MPIEPGDVVRLGVVIRVLESKRLEDGTVLVTKAEPVALELQPTTEQQALHEQRKQYGGGL